MSRHVESFAAVPRACRRVAGFSLIEMLIALAVFSLAVLGLLNLAGESMRTAVAIEEHVLAAVVAENVAVDAATVDVRTLQISRGREEAGGRAWTWTRTAEPTAEPSLLRVDIGYRAPATRVAAECLFRSLQ